MKNNNLSNRSAMCLLIRVEDFLLRYKEKSFADSCLNFMFGKVSRAELDDNVVAAIKQIFRSTDMTVDLVIDRKNYNVFIQEKLEDVPYSALIQIDRPVQISTKLNTGEYAYYVDSNLERMNQIGNKRVISLDELHTFINRGYHFE